MSKIRFTPWIVFACIGTLAGCTSGEGGTAGNTELNVIIPNNAGQSSAPAAFDIQVVEYTISCVNGTNAPLDPIIDSVQPTYDDDVTISGVLEVLDTAAPGNSNQDFGVPLDEVYVFQGFMDLPPTAGCNVQLRARDAGGEVICTEDVVFDINGDDTTNVNVLMYCGISFQAPVGMLDLNADFSFNVANFCPDLFALNCLDSELNVRNEGGFDVLATACQVRFRDMDSSCGGDGSLEPSSCDPQDCDVTDTGLDCAPRPGFVDPEVSTVVVCSSASGACAIDCDGIPNDLLGDPPDTQCRFTGDTLGDIGGPRPGAGAPGPGGFFVACATTVDSNGDTVPLFPGDDITCTAQTDDGDTDCRKTKVVDLTVEGLSACQDFGGDAACDDGNDCTDDTCVDSSCDGTVLNCCSYSDTDAGVVCTDAGGFNGTCDGNGNCVSANCNAAPDPGAFCDDGDPCTVGVCESTGSCRQDPANEGGACVSGTGSGSGSCSSGSCVSNDACLVDSECPDPGTATDCQVGLCNTAVTPYVCASQDAANGAACSPPAGGACAAGVCETPPVVAPGSDLTQWELVCTVVGTVTVELNPTLITLVATSDGAGNVDFEYDITATSFLLGGVADATSVLQLTADTAITNATPATSTASLLADVPSLTIESFLRFEAALPPNTLILAANPPALNNILGEQIPPALEVDTAVVVPNSDATTVDFNWSGSFFLQVSAAGGALIVDVDESVCVFNVNGPDITFNVQ